MQYKVKRNILVVGLFIRRLVLALGVKMRLGRKVYVGLHRMTTGSRWVITHELEREGREKLTPF